MRKGRKATIALLVMLAAGVCLGAVGFAYGGMKPLGFGWMGGRLVRIPGFNDMVEVDKDFGRGAGIKNVSINIDTIGRVTVRQGDTFSVKGRNWKSYGGLDAELDGDTLAVSARALHKGPFGFDWKTYDDCRVDVTIPKGAKLDSFFADIDVGRLDVEGVDAGAATVNADVGDVDLRGMSAGTLEAKADVGKLTIDGLVADSVSAGTDVGALSITGVKAGSMECRTNLGECRLEDVEAGHAKLSSDTGELRADRLTTGGLDASTGLGAITLTRAVLNGESRVDADTGNIRIALDMREDELSYEMDSDVGSVKVDGQRQGSHKRRVTGGVSGTGNTLYARSDAGGISLEFK